MAMGSLDMTAVTLIPDQLIMTQGADMPIFYITDWNQTCFWDTFGEVRGPLDIQFVGEMP